MVCERWLHGECRFGSHCKFLHSYPGKDQSSNYGAYPRNRPNYESSGYGAYGGYGGYSGYDAKSQGGYGGYDSRARGDYGYEYSQQSQGGYSQSQGGYDQAQGGYGQPAQSGYDYSQQQGRYDAYGGYGGYGYGYSVVGGCMCDV